MPLAQTLADETWPRRLDLVVAVARDQRHPAGHPRRIERVEHPEQRIGLEARPALDPDRIADPAQEFDMRRAFEARAIADPQEMRRGVVPVAGQAVLPGQRLLDRKSTRLNSSH